MLFEELALYRYALTNKEVMAIVMQRLVKIDGKVRTDTTYPAGFMDVISIDRVNSHYRLIYDTKGRFKVHEITPEEAKYKLCKVRHDKIGKGGVPHIVTHDGRTIRYVDPDVKVCFRLSEIKFRWEEKLAGLFSLAFSSNEFAVP